MRPHLTHWIWGLAALALASGCAEPQPAGEGSDASPLTNRIEVPPEVVENLGITFAKVERGRVRQTLTVHGMVRVAEDRRWHVVAPAEGRVHHAVKPWQQMSKGDVLATLTSTALADVRVALLAAQEDLLASEIARREVESAGPFLEKQAATLAKSADAARERVRATAEAVQTGKAMQDEARARVSRVEALRRDGAASPSELLAARREYLDVTGSVNDAQQDTSQAEVDAARLDERAAAARVRADTHDERLALAAQRVESARLGVDARLREFSALTGVSVEKLLAETDGKPGWLTVESITIHAPGDGVVVRLSAADGEWATQGDLLFQVDQCTALVFEGHVPEGDLARIPEDTTASVRMPSGTELDGLAARVLPAADPVTRTARVLVTLPEGTVAVPGTSADAYVVVGMGEYDEVLVPRGAVVRDALEYIVFKRDPADPHRVIRTPVTLGRKSRDQVEIMAGVGAGDELVVSGVHQLKQTGLGKAAAGGHFHADGTFHVGED